MQPASFVEPELVPRLPESAVGHKWPKIGQKPRAGAPDIVGLSWEIIGFRNRGYGPAGHPQGVQVNAYSQ